MFTVNFLDLDEAMTLGSNYDDLIDDEYVQYVVYSEEVGDHGNYHIQGYLQLSQSRAFSYVKKLVPRAHWEIAKHPQKAVDYCKKIDETHIDGPWEFGLFSGGQGSRSDLMDVKQMIDEGKSDREIAESYFPTYIRYHRGLDRYRSLTIKPRDFKTEVHIHYGDSGSGKTFFASQGDSVYIKSVGRWWDFYEQQSTVVFDEFTGWIPWNELKRLCDRYPCTVETKGGTLSFTSRFIHFTSNRRPDEWYDRIHRFGELIRRVEYWHHWTGSYELGTTQHKVFTVYDDFLNSINSI